MAEYVWTTLLAVEWVIRLVMLPVIVLRKERPAACLAWLSIVFFEPLVGLVLYLLIGENHLGRQRLERRRREKAAFQRRPRPGVGPEHLAPPGRYEDLRLRLDEEHGGRPPVRNNQIDFLAETARVIDCLVADMDAAEKHVHLLFYIYNDDVVGRRVGDALLRAHRRGVVCRVLVDDVGSRKMLRSYAPELRRQGIRVVSMLTVHLWRILFKRLDIRNHRKIAIIDGRVAYTGSQNLTEEHYGKRRAGAWRDIMARVTGPVVQQLQEVFFEDWFYETQEQLQNHELVPETPATGNVTLQLIPSGPDVPADQLQDLIVRAIFLAQHHLLITSPYFIPGEEMLLALRLAVQRGVRVEILVPQRSDHRLVDQAGRFYLYQLLEQGVHVYFHQKGLLHAKTLTVDHDLAIFGSANFDIRSFRLNFELNLLLHSRSAVDELRCLQAHYLAESRPATLADPQKQRLAGRLKMNLAKLFSPLL